MAKPIQTVNFFVQAIQDHLAVVEQLPQQQELFEQIAGQLTRAIRNGHKILWCGNGGSAADSQHLAAELVGRFQRERSGWASIALTTDTSILTAIGNDYGFEAIFARQVEALCRPGDVLVGLTTSGNSPNVCKAIQCARMLGAFTVGLTGEAGGRIATLADACFCVVSPNTARVQECHILVGHMLCDWVERELCAEDLADE